MAAFVSDTYGREISMFDWLPIGLSVTVPMLPLAWWLLTYVVFPVGQDEIPGGRELIRSELGKLGAMSVAEKRVAVVFALTALSWISRPFLMARNSLTVRNSCVCTMTPPRVITHCFVWTITII